ncbi:MAG TPA: GntR family transcriptional regulator [Cellulomonas sp.]
MEIADGGPLDRATLMHERVHDRLRGMIADRALAPGERLVETVLAAGMGVSRTPVREAIRRLVQEKWLVEQPTGGVVVRTLSASDLIDAYSVRAVLEGLASRLAAQLVRDEDLIRLRQISDLELEALQARDLAAVSRLNGSFHARVADLSRNQPVLDALDGLSIHTVYYCRTILDGAQEEGRRDEFLEYYRQRVLDHAAMVDQLERHDVHVEDSMRRHVASNAESLLRLLRIDDDLRVADVGARLAAKLP